MFNRKLFKILPLLLVLIFAASTVFGATLFPDPKFTVIDSNGDPLSGGKVYFFETGTATPKTTWTDSAEGTPNANPVILDSNGQANIWIDSTGGQYRVRVDTSADVTVWGPIDNIDSMVIGNVGGDAIFLIEHTAAGRHFTPDSSSYSDFATAVSTIGATQTTLIISTSEAVTGNVTVPSTLTLRFRNGGDLDISTGIVVTMTGMVEAGNYQIFKGVGTVVFGKGYNGIANVFWWGAVPGATDSTSAIQAAIESAKAGETSPDSSQIPIIFPELGGETTVAYTYTTLTVYKGTHIKGGGSHRTFLLQESGDTNIGIKDDGVNSSKVVIEGISLVGNSNTSEGIRLIGDGGSAPWGSEGWMRDVLVQNHEGDYGIKVEANASTMDNVRVHGNSVTAECFIIEGGALLADNIIASNCVANFKIIGTLHRFNNVYSESATTTHFEFGDGTTTTTRNLLDNVSVTLKSSATTAQVVLVNVKGTDTQLNHVRNASLNFQTASVLTKLVVDNSNSSGNDYAHEETSNTTLGFWEYVPDLRNYSVKKFVDADFAAGANGNKTLPNFGVHETYHIESLNDNKNLTLPLEGRSYGRTYTIVNQSTKRLRIVSQTATKLYPPLSNTAITNYDMYPGESRSFVMDLDGFWHTLGGLTGITGSATFDPGNLADGAGETSGNITVTGAAFGDYAIVAAPYDLQGIIATAYVSASNTVVIRLQNETTGAIDLASGTWAVTVLKTQ